MPALGPVLHGGGGPQIGEVTCGVSSHLTCKRDLIKMTDYMDGRVTPPKRVTSPAWTPLPPCKQALRLSCPKQLTGVLELRIIFLGRVTKFFVSTGQYQRLQSVSIWSTPFKLTHLTLVSFSPRRFVSHTQKAIQIYILSVPQSSYESWNLKISFLRLGKLWNLIVGPWKSWKIKVLFGRLVTADNKARIT